MLCSFWCGYGRAFTHELIKVILPVPVAMYEVTEGHSCVGGISQRSFIFQPEYMQYQLMSSISAL